MLTELEVTAYCQRLGLSSKAQELLGVIRNAPVRPQPTGSTSKYAPVRRPSRKMGYVILPKSNQYERAFLRELEHEDNVYEFYPQPPKITLRYEAKNGRMISVEHTPSCFVVRKGSLGWEEWRKEEELIRLTDLQPIHYVRGLGEWYCPPGEAVAAPLKFYYRIRSFAEINWGYQINLGFLEGYLVDSPLDVSAAKYKAVCAYVETHPGVPLSELLGHVEGVTSDEIYTLIAQKKLLVGLDAALLSEPERVHVYLENSHAE